MGTRLFYKWGRTHLSHACVGMQSRPNHPNSSQLGFSSGSPPKPPHCFPSQLYKKRRQFTSSHSRDGLVSGCGVSWPVPAPPLAPCESLHNQRSLGAPSRSLPGLWLPPRLVKRCTNPKPYRPQPAKKWHANDSRKYRKASVLAGGNQHADGAAASGWPC